MIYLQGITDKLSCARFARATALLLCLGLSFFASAEQIDQTNHQLLGEDEYRTALEEVVVVGRRPRWREEQEQQQWRPERFKLPTGVVSTPRIQWLPEYDKDERDFYQGVRDRTGEKAEIKLFEWKF